MHILSVQSSARNEASVTRDLSAKLIDKLRSTHPDATVTEREATTGLPVVNNTWAAGAYIPEEDRSPEQREALRVSDELVAEVQAADVLVIGAPIYNFTIPGALKLWIDQICRANVTFKYTENGPVGLLENKKAYIVVASGGTGVGSDIDFHTGYMRHVMGFIGIHDVEFVSADKLMMDEDAALKGANDEIAAIAA